MRGVYCCSARHHLYISITPDPRCLSVMSKQTSFINFREVQRGVFASSYDKLEIYCWSPTQAGLPERRLYRCEQTIFVKKPEGQTKVTKYGIVLHALMSKSWEELYDFSRNRIGFILG